MIVLEYLLARRLANLYWSGFNQKTGPCLLKWSDFRELSEGKTLDNDEFADVVKFLLSFGFLMAHSDDGVIVWHKTEVSPRNIPGNTLHNALKLVSEEDEIEIERELQEYSVEGHHG